ncbi:serine hydrolase domain-containing protein [Flindersiella endophytica]
MGSLDAVARWLDDELAELAAAADVPGATVAVLAGDDVLERATGVLNLRTGVEATTDSVFQIGSVTKVWTATLVMQLVDEGLLDLDTPVREYLPGFRVADEKASTTITPRHCLSHTSGVEGDVFVEICRGDDAIERFVTEVLPEVPQLFSPGEMFSYCNAGFTILGRLIEVLRGQPYHEVLLERLAEPLGLRTVSPRADDAILHRAAVGHLRSNGEWEPARKWASGFAGQPAGSMLSMTAGDLLGFARSHLNGSGAVLASESRMAMRVPQVDLPPTGGAATRQGLGWVLEDWPGGLVIGHDGGTIGQNANLRIAPEHGVAVVLLSNGGETGKLFRSVVGHVFQELAGIEVPGESEPSEHPEPVDPRRYVGRYETRVVRVDVEADANGDLWRVIRLQNELADMLQRSEPERHQIVRLSGETFITIGENGHDTFAFVGDDGNGKAAFFFGGGRVRPRMS